MEGTAYLQHRELRNCLPAARRTTELLTCSTENCRRTARENCKRTATANCQLRLPTATAENQEALGTAEPRRHGDTENSEKLWERLYASGSGRGTRGSLPRQVPLASGRGGQDAIPKNIRRCRCLLVCRCSSPCLRASVVHGRCGWQLQFSPAVLSCRSPAVLRAAGKSSSQFLSGSSSPSPTVFD